MAKTLKNKPKHKFPLYLHATGQWCKKFRGRTFYAGTDKDTALQRYVDEWDDWKAGRLVRDKSVEATRMIGLCNHFMSAKKAGDLTPRSFAHYRETCEQILAAFGKQRTMANLGLDDFTLLKGTVANRYGPTTMGNFIQRVRSIFKHGYDAGLYAVPVRFGPGFAKPKRRTIRLRRSAKPKRMLEPADLRKLIEKAGTPLEAMILLGFNCGFGQMDCSELPKTGLAREGWVDFLRPKTAAPRRCPLWQETIDAIDRALDDP